MYKAVFLDRDGTINEDAGHICSEDKLTFIPGVFDALKLLQEKFLLFIVTNQSGIGKKIFSEEQFLRFNQHYNKILKSKGIKIKNTYYCPHTKEENCTCRKPSPYFLYEAEKKYGIDLKNSFVIGDHPHDIEMAKKVNSGSVYLLTGHGKKHKEETSSIKPDFIAENIVEASNWIINKHHSKGGGR